MTALREHVHLNETALNQIKTFAHPKKGVSAEFLIAIGEKAESTHAIRIVPSPVDYWITTTYARERAFRTWWLRQHRQLPLIQAYAGTCRRVSAGAGGTGALAGRTLGRDAGVDEPMTEKNQSETELLLNGVPYSGEAMRDRRPGARWKRRLLIGILLIETCFVVPKFAHGQFLSIFNSIFSTIQNDIGSSLSAINQVVQQVQKLYQTTVAPLAALNQARGFVANSINSFRGEMNQIFNTSFTSAVTAGPQQFESILHSRISTEIPALQASFTTNYGAIPQVNAASPQDRVMMDMDDALGQENLKTTLVADQGADVILQTADQMENQVALSTPGSNPFLTAQAQVANLRCQAYMQKMLAAELRQEAGRIAHDNVLVKRRTAATGGINSLITGALTAR